MHTDRARITTGASLAKLEIPQKSIITPSLKNMVRITAWAAIKWFYNLHIVIDRNRQVMVRAGTDSPGVCRVVWGGKGVRLAKHKRDYQRPKK